MPTAPSRATTAAGISDGGGGGGAGASFASLFLDPRDVSYGTAPMVGNGEVILYGDPTAAGSASRTVLARATRLRRDAAGLGRVAVANETQRSLARGAHPETLSVSRATA